VRVLHLPSNIASILSHTVRGLSSLGVEARGLVFQNSPIQSAEGVTVIESHRRNPFSPAWFRTQVVFFRHLLQGILWADVLHWYYGSTVFPLGMDLKMIRLFRKPAVVEWLGSDIRIPEVEFEDNPYYKQAFSNGYEYPGESYEKSRRTQKRFIKAGFLPLMIPCMVQYLQKDIVRQFYRVMPRIMLDSILPCYPDPGKRKPLIVHAPSAPVVKGTPAVLRAIRELQKRFDFEFVLIEGMPRQKAIELIRKADLFLDQFVIGYYGMAAVEAMAYGKPVLCYMKPSLLAGVPSDFPIMNATADDLPEKMEALLSDGRLRRDAGERSRVYVEKHHDAVQWARKLTGIYQELLERRKRVK
jgi:glycosyltransferase involved in cell wall biosynthesis